MKEKDFNMLFFNVVLLGSFLFSSFVDFLVVIFFAHGILLSREFSYKAGT
jgi:hypothetical protein